MKLEIYFTDKEVHEFLLSKGYVPINKKKVINHGPYGKLEDVIIEKWVRSIDGSEWPLQEKFNELLKKKLLT